MVRAIHAGLECGLVYEKIKGIDMISFGPTIRGAHTPEEMIEINTTKMFWDLLLDVVRNMPVNQ
jgi:dipeptidase D